MGTFSSEPRDDEGRRMDEQLTEAMIDIPDIAWPFAGESPTATGPGFLCAGCGLRVPAAWITIPPRHTMEHAIYECEECHERSVASRDTKTAYEAAEDLAAKQAGVHTFASGAQSSGRKPAYHLVPLIPLLDRVARRFEVGVSKYGLDSWRKGIGDQEWLLDRANHALAHLSDVLTQLKNGEPSSESRDGDALAAVGWFCFVLAESEDITSTRAIIEEADDEAANR